MITLPDSFPQAVYGVTLLHGLIRQAANLLLSLVHFNTQLLLLYLVFLIIFVAVLSELCQNIWRTNN